MLLQRDQQSEMVVMRRPRREKWSGEAPAIFPTRPVACVIATRRGPSEGWAYRIGIWGNRNRGQNAPENYRWCFAVLPHDGVFTWEELTLRYGAGNVLWREIVGP